VRLYVLDYGLFQVREGGRVIGIPGFLIVTGDHTILVDTGFPARYAEDPAGAARADGLDSFGTVRALTPEHLPAAQLARAGVAPEQVTHLVLTHTHIDHVGGIAEFPQATIVVGKAERALPRPLYWEGGAGPEWPAGQADMEVSRDTNLCPGVRLLSTPGHTPGHLSLLVRLKRTGPLLITGDAVNRPDEVEQGAFAGAWDEARAQGSARKLMQLAASSGASVIFGHDPAQWPKLKKAPEFYE
jgi:N-acyl homoserine lactone hydrolase